MSNIGHCKVCDKNCSGGKKCELCQTFCCEKCNSSHRSDNTCKLFKKFSCQINNMCADGGNSTKLTNFCVDCSKPIGRVCYNTNHKTSISIQDAMSDLRANTQHEKMWLVVKVKETKKYVDAFPGYIKENIAIGNKIKSMIKENKVNSSCLENLQEKLENDMQTYEKKCENIENFRKLAKTMLNELSSLEKVKCPLTCLPIWLDMQSTLDQWKKTLDWTPFAFPGGISFNTDNQEVSNLGTYLESMNRERYSSREPDLPKHDEVDKLSASLQEVVNDQSRGNPVEYELRLGHLEEMLEVLYTLSLESHTLPLHGEKAIISRMFGASTTDTITAKTEQTANKIIQLRQECINKEDKINEISISNINLKSELRKECIEEHKQHVKTLNDAIESKENEIKRLKDKIESLENIKVQSEQKLHDEIKKITEENIVKARNLETHELQNRLVKIEEERLNVNKVQVQLQLKNESTTKQNEELNNVIQNLERKISDLQKGDHDKVQFLKSEIESLKLQNDELERRIKDNIKILEEQTDSLKHGKIVHLNMNHMILERQKRVDEEPLKDKKTEETYLINEPTTKRNQKLDKQIQNTDMEKYEPHNRHCYELQTFKSDELEQHDHIEKLEECNDTSNNQKTEFQNRQDQIDEEQLNEKKIQELQILNKQIQQRNEELKKHIQNLEKESKENRFNGITGNPLAEGNSELTHLCDPNRPVNIGKRYEELFDNEWKDATQHIEVKMLFNNTLNLEEILSRHLYALLKCCYTECLQLSQQQMQIIGTTIGKTMHLTTKRDAQDIVSKSIYEEIAVFRRQNGEKTPTYLLENQVIEDKIVANLTNPSKYGYRNEHLIRRLMKTQFFAKCVHLCWFMAIQEPVMFLSDDLLPDTCYDNNVFSPYMTTGDKVKYVVWPALFLYKGGPLLFEGAVHAY